MKVTGTAEGPGGGGKGSQCQPRQKMQDRREPMFRAPFHCPDFQILTPALFLEESSWDLSL